MYKKKQLGQFFTTNYEYIFQNMEIFEGDIIEPFAGNCDLVKFINKDVELYDIDPVNELVNQRDTLLNPPDYENKYVITNPPYLARNKSSCKKIYDKYGYNDLYKCFLKSIIDSNILGGIIIIPLNFLSSIRKADITLRKEFLSRFSISLINIFEEQVFVDTKYSVCSIRFISGKSDNFLVQVYPKNLEMILKLDKSNNYSIGGEIYNLSIDKEIKIQRATKNNLNGLTNLLLKCIDDNEDNKISLKYVDDDKLYIDKTKNLSARSYATLLINLEMTKEDQIKLADDFNNYLNTQRKKYNSLFLTNYRESNSIARKRISFILAFRICNHLIYTNS